MYPPRKAAEIVLSLPRGEKTGILFGRESSGLTNDEVAMADSIISIPTFKKFSSLNLAQAVNIVGYELWNRGLEQQESGATPPDLWMHRKGINSREAERLAERKELDSYCTRLESILDERNFQPNQNMKENCYRNIRNVYQRVRSSGFICRYCDFLL